VGGPCRSWPARRRGEGAEQGAAADDCAADQSGLLEKAKPGVALLEGFSRVICRLADNVVDVGLFEGCIRFHSALFEGVPPKNGTQVQMDHCDLGYGKIQTVSLDW
jgi:hypothetical protein